MASVYIEGQPYDIIVYRNTTLLPLDASTEILPLHALILNNMQISSNKYNSKTGEKMIMQMTSIYVEGHPYNSIVTERIKTSPRLPWNFLLKFYAL